MSSQLFIVVNKTFLKLSLELSHLKTFIFKLLNRHMILYLIIILISKLSKLSLSWKLNLINSLISWNLCLIDLHKLVDLIFQAAYLIVLLFKLLLVLLMHDISLNDILYALFHFINPLLIKVMRSKLQGYNLSLAKFFDNFT